MNGYLNEDIKGMQTLHMLARDGYVAL